MLEKCRRKVRRSRLIFTFLVRSHFSSFFFSQDALSFTSSVVIMNPMLSAKGLGARIENGVPLMENYEINNNAV